MSEDLYNHYLGILLYDVSDIAITSDILQQLNIETFTTFHYLILNCFQSTEIKQMIIKALECFFNEEVSFIKSRSCFCIGSLAKGRFLTNENYIYIKKALIKLNYLKSLEEEEALVFGNKIARDSYMEFKRRQKSQPKLPSRINLHSILSGLIWKGNKDIEKILNMTVYQIYDGYDRLSITDQCDYLSQGIYHGTINHKEIDNNKLNWAQRINLDN